RRFRRPGFLVLGEYGESDTAGQAQRIVAQGRLVAAAAVGPVSSRVEEGALPDQGQTQIVGVEGQIRFLRIADADGARPRSLQEIAIKNRFFVWYKGDVVLVESSRQRGLAAVLQINPDGIDL